MLKLYEAGSSRRTHFGNFMLHLKRIKCRKVKGSRCDFFQAGLLNIYEGETLMYQWSLTLGQPIKMERVILNMCIDQMLIFHFKIKKSVWKTRQMRQKKIDNNFWKKHESFKTTLGMQQLLPLQGEDCVLKFGAFGIRSQCQLLTSRKIFSCVRWEIDGEVSESCCAGRAQHFKWASLFFEEVWNYLYSHVTVYQAPMFPIALI